MYHAGPNSLGCALSVGRAARVCDQPSLCARLQFAAAARLLLDTRLPHLGVLIEGSQSACSFRRNLREGWWGGRKR
jgi:hypothetical protein